MPGHVLSSEGFGRPWVRSCAPVREDPGTGPGLEERKPLNMETARWYSDVGGTRPSSQLPGPRVSPSRTPKDSPSCGGTGHSQDCMEPVGVPEPQDSRVLSVSAGQPAYLPVFKENGFSFKEWD